MPEINKKTIEYLAGLSRIELKEEEKDKLTGDIKEILDYFEQLQELDTENILPMTGGTMQINSVRGDEEGVQVGIDPEEIIGAFPEKEKGYLKIPPVFEK